MKGVILAAGRGRRLRPFTNNLPKAFIPIKGKPLIKYSLDNLKKAGITDVIIVTGFCESLFKKKLGDSYKDINITYISNKRYETTGSMYSLTQTEGRIDNNILLIESDLLYEFEALTKLINSPCPDVILVAPVSGSDDEVFICVDESDYLMDLGKNITNKDKAKGELVGITKLSPQFLKKLYEKAKEDYRKGEMNYHYEEVIFKLSKTYPIKCLLVEDLAWIEIDRKEDLRRTREIIFPRISKADKVLTIR
ncbi:MAG: hypothetical protein AMJ42_02820 [Deltaproteobacteria bacterium DG_8]|nr:MAG: hypothetical protein AMJ42_02820 [Deltaproteobacteria bacterium DG_8]